MEANGAGARRQHAAPSRPLVNCRFTLQPGQQAPGEALSAHSSMRGPPAIACHRRSSERPAGREEENT